MKKVSNILWGIIFVAAGVILALNAIGITHIDLFFDGWWTLFIIVPCAVGLFTDYDKGGNLIGICIGVFLLLCCQGILHFDLLWKLLIPAIIVTVGVKLILGGIWGNRCEQVYARLRENNASIPSGAAVFSGSTLDYTGEVFEGAQIHGDCAIHASAIFGGIDIYVPENLNVKVNSNSIFGGVSGKARGRYMENQNTLYVNATCLFGGVEIK